MCQNASRPYFIERSKRPDSFLQILEEFRRYMNKMLNFVVFLEFLGEFWLFRISQAAWAPCFYSGCEHFGTSCNKGLTEMKWNIFFSEVHCVKNVCIRSFSGPYFPSFDLNTERYRIRENTDQKNSENQGEYGHFSRSIN